MSARADEVKHVLIVDPSATVRAELRSAFAGSGLAVAAVASLAEALGEVARHPIDLAVIDQAPHDPLVAETVRRLLADPAQPQLRVLLLDGDAALGEGQPRVRVLARPDDAQAIVRAGLDALDLSGSAAAAGTPTVLVVDDSPTFRASMIDLLAGWTVIEAESGERALELAGRDDLDAVLLDRGLPDRSGIEVCRALRARDAGRTLPVIMVTASEEEEHVLAAFAAGADDYVVKGFSPVVLLARLRAHVRRSRTERAARRSEAERRLAEAVAGARAELLAQVNRQRDELASANEELERYAALASHDLQTPLRQIASYLDLIERRAKLDDTTRGFLRFAVLGAERMRLLVSRMLEYAQRGWDDTSKDVDCEARAAAEEAGAGLREVIGETGATLTIDALPRVRFDPLCLQQVFANLIGNALKYRSERPAVVKVAVRDAGALVRLEVVDNGQGIDAAHRGRIFAMFERLHGAEIPGAGIGLALCRKIVRARGGEIGVESVAGEGSTFWFTVPRGNPA